MCTYRRMWRDAYAVAFATDVSRSGRSAVIQRRIAAFAVACESTAGAGQISITIDTVTGSIDHDPTAVAKAATAGRTADAVRRLAAAGGGAGVAVAVACPCVSPAARVADLRICLTAAAASGGVVAACTVRVAYGAGTTLSGAPSQRPRRPSSG